MAAEIAQLNCQMDQTDGIMTFLSRDDGEARILDALKMHSRRKNEKFENLLDKNVSLEGDLSRMDVENAALREKLNQAEKLAEAYEGQLEEENNKNGDLKESLNDVMGKKAAMEAFHIQATEKHQAEKTALDYKIKKLEADLEREREIRQSAVGKMEAELETKSKALAASQVGAQSVQDALEREEAENRELRAENDRCKYEIAKIKQDMEREFREKEKIVAMLQDEQHISQKIREKMESEIQKNEDLVAAKKVVEGERDDALRRDSDLREGNANLRTDVEKMTSEKDKLEMALMTEKNEKNRLQNSLDNEREEFEIKLRRSRAEEEELTKRLDRQKKDIDDLHKELGDSEEQIRAWKDKLCSAKESHSKALRDEQNEHEEAMKNATAQMQCKYNELEYRIADLTGSLTTERARLKKRDDTIATAEKTVEGCMKLVEQGTRKGAKSERKTILQKIKTEMENFTKRAHADQAGSNSKRLSYLAGIREREKTQREIYCDNLRAGWTDMIHDLDGLLDSNSSDFLDTMYQNKVIESSEFHQIRSLNARTLERSRAFLTFLGGKNVCAIEEFIRTLKGDDHTLHLAEIMERCSSSISATPSSEDVSSAGSDSDDNTEKKAVQVSEPGG